MEGDWLPPQAPGGNPPPPVAPDAPPPPAPFEARDEQQAAQPAAASQEPNTEAVAAMTCAIAGAGLLYWTNGLSSVVSLILGVIAAVYARRARRNVAEGRTTKHADLSTAANIAGLITVGLGTIATIVWTLVILIG